MNTMMPACNTQAACCGVLLYFCVLLGSQINGAPVQYCDASEGQFNPFWDGTCHDGTAWSEDVKCCLRCDICGPGFHQRPGCKGPCHDCANDTFSDKAHNASCIEGFFSHPGIPSGENVACLICLEGLTDKWCKPSVEIPSEAPIQEDVKTRNTENTSQEKQISTSLPTYAVVLITFFTTSSIFLILCNCWYWFCVKKNDKKEPKPATRRNEEIPLRDTTEKEIMAEDDMVTYDPLVSIRAPMEEYWMVHDDQRTYSVSDYSPEDIQ